MPAEKPSPTLADYVTIAISPALIIAMIVRSMFTAGTPTTINTPQPQQQAQNSPENNFIVFGATNTPAPVLSATPNIEITPTPVPVQQPTNVTYKTLRKGDQSVEVKLMQVALTGLKSGMGAKMIRPAAASAARTTVGMICLSAGFERSKLRKNTAIAATATTNVSNAAC